MEVSGSCPGTMLLVLLSKGRSMVTDELSMGIENGAPRSGPRGGSGATGARAASRAAGAWAPTLSNGTGWISRSSYRAIRECRQRRSSSGCRASTRASTGAGSRARCSGASGGGTWRAGPERELFFKREWRPGQQCQSGFTHTSSLGVTFLGEAAGLAAQSPSRSGYTSDSDCASNETMIRASSSLAEAISILLLTAMGSAPNRCSKSRVNVRASPLASP